MALVCTTTILEVALHLHHHHLLEARSWLLRSDKHLHQPMNPCEMCISISSIHHASQKNNNKKTGSSLFFLDFFFNHKQVVGTWAYYDEFQVWIIHPKKNTPRNPLQRHKPAKEAHQFFDARHRRRAGDPRTATRKTEKKTPREVLESRSTATRARTACATF